MYLRLNFTLKRRYLTGILIVLLFCPFLKGLDPTEQIDRYLVDEWKMADGLPSDTIRSISQTPDGFLWFGTSKGLVRFDGIVFSILPFTENMETRSLFVDRKGTLWIGSSRGLCSYAHRTGRFKRFTRADGITEDGIRRIKENVRGNLWISFETSYTNLLTNEKFKAFDASHGLAGKKINAIVEDRRGNLLLGSRENGVFIYDKGQFSHYPIAGIDGLIIITMHEDRQGNLWIGTDNGLFRVTGKKAERYTRRYGLSNNYISVILEDSERNLWVGTERGLNRLKKRRVGAVAFESLREPFSSAIYCLFEDREKSLWVGTDKKGIRRLKHGKFKSYEPFAAYREETPLALFEDRAGDTWIGTASGKLLCFRGDDLIESLTIPGSSGKGIAAIAEDADGNLWIGTNGRGGVFQKKKGSFIRFTAADGLADNVVTSIYRDSRGDLWFATFAGVSVRRHAGGAFASFTSRNGLSGKRVHDICEDKNQGIWIAADRGITVLKKGKIAQENIMCYLPGVSVTCIHEDTGSPGTGSIFWIATKGQGLKRFKDGKFVSCTSAHGMTTDSLYRVLEDEQDNLWITSNSGVLKIDKKEFGDFAAGRIARVRCGYFGLSDGLKSLEFDNLFSRNSVLETGMGEFWFLTKKGISIIKPAQVSIDKSPPPVVITAAFFDGEPWPLPMDVPGRTGKGIRDVGFRFTAPTFLSPEKVEFKYRLEGLQKEWVFSGPGKERAACYTDLPPGTFTFRVTACNADRVWNTGGAAVTFTIEPFFYETLLFKILFLFLFCILSIAVFYSYRKRRIEKKTKYKASPLNPRFAGECIGKLRQLMEIDKVYRDEGMTLVSLAKKLEIPPHQLSQLLNEKLKRHFFDFINHYRIEEAKKILRTPKGTTRKINIVAEDVGFKTMAAFYRAFKKHTGMTPNRYKKSTVRPTRVGRR